MAWRFCDIAWRFCDIVSCFCDMAAPGHGAVPDNLCQPCPEPGQESARTERGQSPCGAGSWWRSSSTMNARDFPWLLPLALLVILGRPLDTSSRPIGDTGTSVVLAEAPEQRDVGPGTPPWGRMSLLCWAGAALDLLSTGVSLSRWLCGWLRRRWGQVRDGMVPGVGERPRASGQARVGRNLRAPAEEESRAGPRGPGALGQPFAQGPEAAGGARPLGGNRARAEPQEHRAEAPPGAARAGASVSRRGQRRPWRAQPPIGPLCPLSSGSLRCALQEKRQSPSASAGPGCQGHGRCKELLQLLRDSRALMRLCLRHRPRQRPGEKRPRKWGVWKRRRIYFSP